MWRSVVLLWLVATVGAAAERELDFQFRYHASQTVEDKIDQTAFYRLDHKTHGFEFAGKIEERAWSVGAFEYKAEAYLSPFDWFRLALRLDHNYLIPEGIGSSTFLGTAELQTWPFSFLGFFASIGWFERFTTFQGSPLPTFSTEPYDHNLACAFGFDVVPHPKFHFVGKTATFGKIEVFNLNNPFFFAAVEYQMPDRSWVSLYSRYKVLLGFGRLDEIVVGAGWRFTLPPSFGS